MILFHQVPIECINHVAVEYQVPAALIMAIIQVEGGSAGLAMSNTNGTFDLGVMQINSSWAATFEQKGYSIADVQNDPCKNVDVGTWILSQCLANDSNNLIQAVGDYHSHTPSLNHAYAVKVLSDYQIIHDTLDSVISPKCKKLGEICN